MACLISVTFFNEIRYVILFKPVSAILFRLLGFCGMSYYSNQLVVYLGFYGFTVLRYVILFKPVSASLPGTGQGDAYGRLLCACLCVQVPPPGETRQPRSRSGTAACVARCMMSEGPGQVLVTGGRSRTVDTSTAATSWFDRIAHICTACICHMAYACIVWRMPL